MQIGVNAWVWIAPVTIGSVMRSAPATRPARPSGRRLHWTEDHPRSSAAIPKGTAMYMYRP